MCRNNVLIYTTLNWLHCSFFDLDWWFILSHMLNVYKFITLFSWWNKLSNAAHYVTWSVSELLPCCLQIHCADHLSWHHGPRRGQTETHRRQNPWILFLKCKELQIKTARRKLLVFLCLISTILKVPMCNSAVLHLVLFSETLLWDL